MFYVTAFPFVGCILFQLWGFSSCFLGTVPTARNLSVEWFSGANDSLRKLTLQNWNHHFTCTQESLKHYFPTFSHLKSIVRFAENTFEGLPASRLKYVWLVFHLFPALLVMLPCLCSLKSLKVRFSSSESTCEVVTVLLSFGWLFSSPLLFMFYPKWGGIKKQLFYPHNYCPTILVICYPGFWSCIVIA